MGSNQHSIEHLLNQALQLHQSGQLAQAEPLYQQVLTQQSTQVDALHYLGLLRHQNNQNHEAVALLQKAHDLSPGNPTIIFNLGVVNQAMGNLQIATEFYTKSIELNPAFAMAYNNLGSCYARLGQEHQALANFEKAVEIDPNCIEALNNLGNIYKDRGNLSKAESLYKNALIVNSQFNDSINNLGVIYQRKGLAEEAQSYFIQAMELTPTLNYRSNMLMNLNYCTQYSPQQVFHLHKEIGALFPQGDSLPPKRTNKQKIRIGYVSPDFRTHSVAYFTLPIFRHHDKSRFEICAYSNSLHEDEMTDRLRSSCDQWCNISTLTDDEVFHRIRSDEIDILVDLSGHSAANRLGVFSRKPCPAQITYLGYPNTTGIAAMDFRLVDEHTDPPGSSEAFSTEKLIRHPSGFLCYEPPKKAPPITSPPFLKNNMITFGSFNNTAKINPPLIELWSQLLSAVENSRMVLKSSAFHDEATKKEFLNAFSQHGIDSKRISLQGHTGTTENHLEKYNDIDIALDTYPYNGTTTTCEALWMGVPVITLKGESHASRVSFSILQKIGKSQWVANSMDEYHANAAQLANNLGELLQFRNSARQEMANSALMDGVNFTAELETIYEKLLQ